MRRKRRDSIGCPRRHFLAAQSMGLGGLALSWMLKEEGIAGESRPELESPVFDLSGKAPQSDPQAKAMISLWMQGGPSHVDLCDPKPELDKLDGKDLPGELPEEVGMPNNPTTKTVMASPWEFRKYGESGMEWSELLPHIGGISDEMTLIRSMYAPTANNHFQATRAFQRADKSNRLGKSDRPSLGSWFTYALGADSRNLPAFVALSDIGSLPIDGTGNWTNGMLPSVYQGTLIRPREPRIVNLDAPPYLKGEPQREALGFLDRMNRRHLEDYPANSDLEARISSFELAARMQLAASDAMDLSQETEATRRMYGLDDPITEQYGANCLLARRLIERGVRFVQVLNGSQYWDHHSRIVGDLPACCARTDKPVAALVKDLKQRGLLDSTIVHWGGEMGRLPVIQGKGTNRRTVGRDHNVYGFSTWLAGGGFKRGHIHGATDEFGFKAIEGRVGPADYLATLAHQFGLNPEDIVFESAGRKHSLIDGQEYRIVNEILRRPRVGV